MNFSSEHLSWPNPPCCSCRTTVTWKEVSLFCSGCDSFFHSKCVNHEQTNQETITWICSDCSAPLLNLSHISGDESLDSFITLKWDDEIDTSNNYLDEQSECDTENFNSYFNLPLPSSGLRFGQWNINYLTNSKFDQIKLLLTNSQNSLDVLFLTETFLKPINCDSLYQIPGYSLLRKDRLSKEGGGIAVYYRNDLNCKRRDDLECDSVEILWLEICPYKSNRSLLIAGCYRPPSYTKAQDEMVIGYIESAYLTNKEIILTGDMNINFLSPDFKKHHLPKSLKTMLFTQLVTVVTRPVSGTCLDHIYSNLSQHITNVIAPDFALSDHLPVLAVRKYFKQPKQTRGHNTITYRNLKKIDKNAFKSTLGDSPWDTVFIFDDIDDSLSAWENIFLQAVNSHAPMKQKRISKSVQPLWITSKILEQLKKRDNLLKKAKRSKSEDDWKRYRAARNLATTMIEKSKRTFFKSSIKDSRGDTKSMWRLIKSLTGSKQTNQPESLTDQDNSTIIDTNAGIADHFNFHFTTVASKLKSSLNFINVPDLSKLYQFVSTKIQSDSIQFSLPPVNLKFVVEFLNKLPSNKATGVDGISVKLLKMGINELAPSITKLINLSISSEQFPSRWKTARVIALFKSGNVSDVNNYRPISILPVLSKIIERHVHECLIKYLTDNDLLYSNQSGFRRKFSTETALAYMIDSLLFNLDKNRVNGLVLVDYKKAFDMVDHSILLSKLKTYKCDAKALKWFKSYLEDRKQFVSFKGVSSTTRTITDGVPQGSILGPLLFLIFINDLPLHVNSQVDLFADDTTLMSSSDYKYINELQTKLSLEVTNLEEWASTNHLPLNSSKTKTILVCGKRLRKQFTPTDQCLEVKVNGTLLKQVSHARLLGLELDEDLSFDIHVENLVSRVSKRIGILKKVKSYLPRKERVLFYNALIKPVLTYCNIIWTSCSKVNLFKIFKLQKLAARIILDAQPRHSSVDLFNTLGWVPIYVESDIRKCALAYKRTKGETPEYLSKLLVLNGEQHTRVTRNAHCTFIIPKYNRTTEAGRSFSINSIKCFNKLPLKLRNSASLPIFKRQLFSHFKTFQKEHKSFTTFMESTF